MVMDEERNPNSCHKSGWRLIIRLLKKEEEGEERNGDCTKVFLLGILMAGLMVIWDERQALSQPRIDHVIPEKYQMLERRTHESNHDPKPILLALRYLVTRDTGEMIQANLLEKIFLCGKIFL